MKKPLSFYEKMKLMDEYECLLAKCFGPDPVCQALEKRISEIRCELGEDVFNEFRMHIKKSKQIASLYEQVGKLERERMDDKDILAKVAALVVMAFGFSIVLPIIFHFFL